MRVAILGTGNMGSALAKRLSGKVDLFIGTRDTAAAGDLAAGLDGQVTLTDYESAATNADIVVLALPFDAALEQAKSNKGLAGKPVVDITNPLKADFSGLTIGFDTSAAEQIQQAAPDARVVKAFNTIFAGLLATSTEATRHIQVFLAGNDEAAVSAVSELVALSGFTAEVAGDLELARLVEPLGMLNIRFGFFRNKGQQIAPVWTGVAA